MSDNKRYYYLKLKDNFFDSEEIKILESLPNGIYYSNLLIKLYLRSLKFQGALRFNEYIPYDENMIATITNLNIDVVRSGLKVLASMNLIEKLDDGTIYMINIQSFIGKSSSEGDRKKLYREKIQKEKLLLDQNKQDNCLKEMDICPEVFKESKGTLGDKSTPDIENRDKELENRYRDTKDSELESRVKDKRSKEIGESAHKDKNKDKDMDIEKAESCRANIKSNEEVESLSVSLLKYFDNITCSVGRINLGALKSAISIHGATNVKKAMDKALEMNKPTMIYINGILKNWRMEGYSEEGKGENGGLRKNISTNTSKKIRGFKPKQCRRITEGEPQELWEEIL